MDHNLRSVESHEAAIDKRTQAWNESYRNAYAMIPFDYKGGMLQEAINCLTPRDIVDDIIIASYATGDRESAVTALFLLLDSWRKREAERIADKETGE